MLPGILFGTINIAVAQSKMRPLIKGATSSKTYI